MSGPLLGVWAHPDDEAYLSAGLMLRARRAGRDVVVVTATAGEAGTDDPQTWPPERLGPLRRRELHTSLATLGVHDLIHWDLPDGGCASLDGVARIEKVIASIQPDIIVTFGPDGMTGHSDHRTISKWTTEAWRRSDTAGELWYATITDDFHREWEQLHDELGLFAEQPSPPRAHAADLVEEVVLTPEELDLKFQALRAHASQSAALIDAIGEDTYRQWWSRESFVAAPRVP